MDLRQIKNLMKEFEDSKIHKLEIKDNDFSIMLEKETNNVTVANTPVTHLQTVQSNVPVKANEEVFEELNTNVLVKAPLVGTYYASPSPDSDAFVDLHQKVKKGDTLFIIEAMKVMNEITAPVSGTIEKMYVSDASMVEFGQVVMEIKE